MPGEFGPPPPLRYLSSQSDRALIIRLREAVARILANNVLHHFTDHSVIHSDHVTQIVDELAAPLQRSAKPLRAEELIVLYSACYLHDIGLQFENAGETATILQIDLNLPWQDLDEGTRRDVLRRYHHRISAEIVQASVRAERPVIGLQLSAEYQPARVACLCEAHNLFLENPDDRDRYEKITEDGPNLAVLRTNFGVRWLDAALAVPFGFPFLSLRSSNSDRAERKADAKRKRRQAAAVQKSSKLLRAGSTPNKNGTTPIGLEKGAIYHAT